MNRSYSAFGWLCMTVGALLIIGGLANWLGADGIAAAFFTAGFILGLQLRQSYRNARSKARQARTAPMVRPNLPHLPEQPRRGVR
ncbi:hypothetical protein [Xanthomonas campestris]|uniref:hypothetical protein n=1 Tax=Xanthomonas campestris TaxID=339 RepID=UPI0005B6B0CC|nr:hypothetical protein [Xanthomonas campestris]KIQ21579.1 hypothetical protein RT95_20765 [Xanthomonas campestris]